MPMNLVEKTDPILLQPAIIVLPIDKKILANEMLQAMYKFDGIGLASPQVGLQHDLFVMGDHKKEFICFQPVILESSEDIIEMQEGCLSFPDLYLTIKRPREVLVEWLDENNERQEETLTGKWARCFQHEYDHLFGIVFTTKVSKLRLMMAERKRTKYLNRKDTV